MNMDDYYQFTRTWLEEQMFDIAEEHINLTAAVVGVAETVLMDLDFASNTFTIETWPDKTVFEICGLTT